MRISEFAAKLGAEIHGLNDDFEIVGITTLERATENEVSFISDKKYLPAAESSRAGALIISEKLKVEGRPTIPLQEPWTGVLFLLNHLYPEGYERFFTGIHPTAIVDPTAQLEADVVIGPYAVIGPRTRVGSHTVVGPACVIGQDCVIGSNCLFHPSVTIAHQTEIGNRVILHSGVVIGADGFKYEVIGGRFTKIPQVGRVVIEDDVEIGANSCVDRASFTETRIGANTKIDNFVQIAHNVTIGANCIIVAQCGIAGSTQIGDGSILAAQVGVADNLKIGRNVKILGRSGVKDNIPDGETWIGYPARPFRQFARISAAEGHLPELVAELNKLKQRVAELEEKLAQS